MGRSFFLPVSVVVATLPSLDSAARVALGKSQGCAASMAAMITAHRVGRLSNLSTLMKPRFVTGLLGDQAPASPSTVPEGGRYFAGMTASLHDPSSADKLRGSKGLGRDGQRATAKRFRSCEEARSLSFASCVRNGGGV